MVFLFIFLIIILMIITIRIKFDFKNFNFSILENKKINKNYEIKIVIYIFQKIPILKTKIDDEKIQKIINNEKLRNAIKSQEIKIFENRKNIDKEIISAIKNIKLEVDEMNLKIEVGTENASMTAFIIPIISTILAIFLSKKVKKYNNQM